MTIGITPAASMGQAQQSSERRQSRRERLSHTGAWIPSQRQRVCDAKLEEVAASDVAWLIIGVERAPAPVRVGDRRPAQADVADDIQAALRQQASFRGEVVYDPETNVAKSVRLRRIDRGEQFILGLDAGEFWQARSFAELAQLQGAG